MKTLRLDPKKYGRVLITSDIHGYLDYLKALLEKAGFCESDLLIVVGDMLEKGPDSLGTLRYLKELCEKGRAIVLMGNVDYWRLISVEMVLEDPNNAQAFLDHLVWVRDLCGTSLFDEMCREVGIAEVNSLEGIVEATRILDGAFKAEFDFLRGLPTVIHTPKYVFVHGGLRTVEQGADAEGAFDGDPYELLKFDGFINETRKNGIRFPKYVVAGHWPVVLYESDRLSSNPVLDRELKILAIDGGCGLKVDGQLNMLVLPSLDCEVEEIAHLSYDALETVTAKSPQRGSDESFKVIYFEDNRLVRAESDYAVIENVARRTQFAVPLDYLYDLKENYSVGDVVHTRDCTNYLLDVDVGDELRVIRRTAYGLFAKKNGVSGWYLGETE